MQTDLKQQVHQLVDQLPSEATIDDLLRELYELKALQRAQADIAAGRVVPHHQAREYVNKLRRKQL